MIDLIKTSVVIIFAFSTLVFVVYSIVALYSLNTYSRTRLTSLVFTLTYIGIAIYLIYSGLSHVQSL